MSDKNFVHLRVHSAYSLSEGASLIGDLLKTAEELNFKAMALTDHGNMFGALTFSEYAIKKKIQPIIGCHLTLKFTEEDGGNIVLLAKDEIGYKNLCHLVFVASQNGANAGVGGGNKNNFLVPDNLINHADGLILLTGGGKDGLLPKVIEQNKEWAEELSRWFLQVFSDRVYIEICRNTAPNEKRSATEEELLRLAMGGINPVRCADGVIRKEIPIVGTSDVWYASKDRREAKILLDAIANKAVVSSDGGKIEFNDDNFYDLKSPEEMAEIFADIPEAAQNSVNIARRCAFFVRERKPMLPSFPTPGDKSEAETLREAATLGLEARLRKSTLTEEEKEERRRRLDYELNTIERMGFPGYFLIVGDFIQWAKANDIPVGPGRGSGAGSIVAWSLGITELDPLRFGLLFERFLNPERVSMPDFDIDFCQDKRDLVREYVTKKYGKDRVALIATFGIIKSKTALTDMQRVLADSSFGFADFNEIKDITKAIPNKESSAEPVPLEEAIVKSEIFKRKVESSEKLTNIFNQAKKVEGLIRTSGAHAAGLVIGDRPLDELIPLSYDGEAKMAVSGFDMKGVEKSGLVKFDFLGLTTLSVLKKACDALKKKDIHIDLLDIPLDDAGVFQMLSAGRTSGVFQFEGPGMRNVLKKIKPTRFEDLIAIAALFRPGPMDYINNYAERKAGREVFRYPGDEEKTRPILEETYGIMVYQEQVMQVAQACAGYSLGGADLLRRAMGKKIPAEMAKQRQIFVHGDETANPPVPGAVKLGMSEAAANGLFDDIVPFAGYGFNKSHAAAYALIGYQTAWMKHHYPAEFLAATMSYFIQKPERLSLIRDDLDEIGIPILPPSVNKSADDFVAEGSYGPGLGGNAVRFGLSAVKQLGQVATEIYRERLRKGEFSDIYDFITRMSGKMGKSHATKLAEIGAFDELWPNRRQAAEIIGWALERKIKEDGRQLSFFSDKEILSIPQHLKQIPEWQNLNDRKFNAAGFYFDWHPLDEIKPMLIHGGIKRKKSVFEWMSKNGLASVQGKKVCGFVEGCFIRQSKNDNSYVDIIIAERSDKYRVSYFPKKNNDKELYQIVNILIGAQNNKAPVILTCSMQLNNNGDDVWVNATDVVLAETYLSRQNSDVVIKIDPNNIMLTRDEGEALRRAGHEISDIYANISSESIQSIRDAATERAIKNIIEFLEKSSNNTANRTPKMITIEAMGKTEGDSQRQTVFCAIAPDSHIFNVIKQMDGVSHIETRFKTPKPGAIIDAAPSDVRELAHHH